MALTRRVKDALDPQGILNPGAILDLPTRHRRQPPPPTAREGAQVGVCRAELPHAISDRLPPVRSPHVVPEEPDPEGVQVLRLVDDAPARAGHHLHRRAQRLRQVQRRRRARLGDGRAGRQVAARRQDGGRHLRRHVRPPAAGPRRGRADHRQLRRRAADRVRRGHDQPHDVPQRRVRVRHQRQLVPAARRPGAALRLRHRPRDARHRRAGPARHDPARHPRGPPRLHRGGRRRPQAPQAQGEGAPQARLHRGQPDPAQRPALAEIRRQLKPLGRQAEVARRAADCPGRRPRRPRPAARRRPGDRPHRAGAGDGRRVDPGRAPRAGRGRRRPRPRAGGALEAALREDLPALARAQETWFALSGLRERLRGTQSLAAERVRNAAGTADVEEAAVGPRPRAARGRGRAGARAGAADRRRGRARTGRRSRRPSPAARPPRTPPPRRSAGSPASSAPPPTAARAWPGCTARSTRSSRAPPPPTTRSADSAWPARRPWPAPTVPSATSPPSRPGSPGSTPARRVSTPSTRRPSTPSTTSTSGSPRPATRPCRPTATAPRLAARKDALELGLNRKDGAGALLAASDAVSGLLGSVAALLVGAHRLRDRRRRARSAPPPTPSPSPTPTPPSAPSATSRATTSAAPGCCSAAHPRSRPRTGPACPAARRTPSTSSSARHDLRPAR